MTATDGNSGEQAPAPIFGAGHKQAARTLVDRACQAAIHGRRASRALTEFAKRYSLGEAEFLLLWQLCAAPTIGIDQTALACALAFSPAQISASIERLRARGLAAACGTAGDRRRRYWQLSASGHALFNDMLRVDSKLISEWAGDVQRPYGLGGNLGGEVAA